MPETSLAQERGCWRVAEHPIQIDYSHRVLADLERDVVAGFHGLKRGGVEVGGVLLGTRTGQAVTVLGYRPLKCEHTLGPSFVLSAREHESLAILLESLRADPNLQGRVAVGWYHSSNRSNIHLSPTDLELFDRHFPEPWQIALVLKPDSFEPTKAGFFVREEDGSIRADSSYQEFSLPSRYAATSVRQTSAALSRPSLPLPPPPSPAPIATRPLPPLTSKRRLPGFILPRPVLIAAFTALAVALVVIGFAGHGINVNAGHPLALTLQDNQGHLRIGWNRAATPFSEHPSGLLEVKEGDRVTRFDLKGDQVQRGTFDYSRSSSDVVVNLKVGGVEETAVFVGPPPAAVQERMREAADVAPTQAPRPAVVKRPVRIKKTQRKARTSSRKKSITLKRPPARRSALTQIDYMTGV